MPRNRAPLREQSFRIAALVLPAVIVVVIVLIILPLTSGNQRSTPFLILGGVVALVVLFGATAVGLSVGRRIVGDRIEVALRTVGGKWMHGRLTIHPGALTFEPYVLQMRIPSGKRMELEVEQLGEDTGRTPSLRQIWSVNPQLHIVDLATNEGHFEMGALPGRIRELRERLVLP